MAKELPKYQELADWSKEQILSRRLAAGDKFYSENQLTQLFHVSRQTVRQAVGQLEQEGFVERRRGSGTYVVYGAEKRREPTRAIGVISTYSDTYIFPPLIKGIDKVLSESGYTMQLTLTHNRVENEARALSAMLAGGVDGIVVEPTKSALPNANRALYQQVEDMGVPLLFFNAHHPGTPFPHVGLDDRQAGRLATRHLIETGHRDIAGLFQSDDLQGHRRYAGYVEALGEAGLEIRSSRVLWYSTEDLAHLAEDFHRVLRVLEDATALVCYNDQVAFLTVAELHKLGRRVPEDLSLVGVDDSNLAELCEVPLTTVANPMERLGRAAARGILRLIENPGCDVTAEFDPVLVRRKSVRSLLHP